MRTHGFVLPGVTVHWSSYAMAWAHGPKLGAAPRPPVWLLGRRSLGGPGSKVHRFHIWLAHLVELLWRLRIYPVDPGDAATTCLLALACPDGAWVLGGVGDGLAIAKTGSNLTIVVGQRGEDFGNETLGLGVSKGSGSWKLVTLPASVEDRVAVLATDGIADDLVPEKINDFCDWLVVDFQNLKPADRWRQLMMELKDWPTPNHLDDKTLAVLRTTATSQGPSS